VELPLSTSRTARRPPHWLGLALALGLVLLTPRPALAHLHLRSSVPAAEAALDTVPREIRLVFSEPAELSVSSIRLTGPDGSAIELGAIALDLGSARALVAPIAGSLAPGEYTVSWRTASADGHPVEGHYSFRIAPAAYGLAVAAPPTPTTGMAGSQAGPDSQTASATSGSEESGDLDVGSPLYVAVRWLNFAALLGVVGAVAFALLVAHRVPELAADPLKTVARAGLASAIVLALAAVARLVAQSYALHGVGLRTIVLDTGWGRAWLLGAAALVVALAAFAGAARRGRRCCWAIALVAAIALALSSSLSGHAVATPRVAPLAVVADTLHILSAGGWLGTLLIVVLVGIPLTLRQEAGGRARAASNLINAFSPVALACASLLVITGLLAAWLHLGSVPALWQSRYGQVLLVKLAVIVFLVALGFINWRVMRPALGTDAATRRIRGSAVAELALGTLVLAVTAVLVATSPPAEARDVAIVPPAVQAQTR
jgi:putative copper export protein/methionine-rich copper-binding protein CopC